jgi:antagonist of KipI
VAGANFELFVDEAPVSCEGVLDLRAGAVLRFGARRAGARAYVAVEGGFDVPMVLGSRATHLPSGMGGWRGRALRRGDRVPLGAAATSAPRTAAWTGPDADSSSKIVRILPGPQDDRFSGAAMEALVSGPYRVDLDSNRMGYRLSGARLEHRGTADIISDATPLGTIQVPSSGQPMLLMADRQTTGGYAKLATVIAADLGIVGQAAPGDFLRFRTCSRAEALTALVARERALLALESIAS